MQEKHLLIQKSNRIKRRGERCPGFDVTRPRAWWRLSPIPSRVHVTGKAATLLQEGLLRDVRQPRSARLDLGYTARPHVLVVVVVRVVDVGDSSGSALF
jgi:hypothetical protein